MHLDYCIVLCFLRLQFPISVVNHVVLSWYYPTVLVVLWNTSLVSLASPNSRSINRKSTIVSSPRITKIRPVCPPLAYSFVLYSTVQRELKPVHCHNPPF